MSAFPNLSSHAYTMSNQRNGEIKNYICSHFIEEDLDLLATKKSILLEGLPQIAIPENVGKLIYMLAKIHQPKRILEIGTLAGYSTLWLAKGAPDAHIITLECSSSHAAIARNNFVEAQLHHRIELIEGDAFLSIQTLIESKSPPFDLIFLDAKKSDYPAYLPLVTQLARSKTLLLTDNLIPKGAAINHPAPTEVEALSVYQYNSLLANHPAIETILVPTIVDANGRLDALGISLFK